MWYFTWILGIGLALAFGIINVMWLEANYAFGERDEEITRERFEQGAAKQKQVKTSKKSWN
ncbi:MAG: cytochrome bd-I oxidase subunit CydX [Pseudomonadota bacterium]